MEFLEDRYLQDILFLPISGDLPLLCQPENGYCVKKQISLNVYIFRSKDGNLEYKKGGKRF